MIGALTLVIALAVSPVTLSASGPLTTSSAQAASASDWDAGYIVSDANFYDGSAMSTSSVQSFLRSQNSGCAAGSVCLLNYTQNTPSMNSSSYCSAMPGVNGESAASIIARVGAACNISQRTLLVLLQKEQGLVTSRAPSQFALDHATGFNCPDTAPCNPAYAGFFYQVYNAARQFQLYRAFPSSFNYKARQVNNIQWSPNACGSSPVYIANDATAALYIYTPYQPNSAALANMYGTGDVCSSYGNRNFWRLWSDWFGSPTGQPLTLVQASGTTTVFLVASGLKYSFPTAELLSQYASFGSPTVMSQAQIDSYPNGGVAQRGIADTNGDVWLVDSGWRFHFVTCQQVTDFGMTCGSLPVISSVALAKKTMNAGDLRNVVQLPDGSKWLVQNSTRREVPQPNILPQYGISAAVSGISYGPVASFVQNDPIIAPGFYFDGAGNSRAVTPNGQQLDAPAGLLQSGVGLYLTPTSFRKLPAAAGTIPARFGDAGQSYILTSNGRLRVSAGEYGPAASFPSVPAELVSTIPSAGQMTSAHFVRERSSSQIYLASGGFIQPVDAGSVSWISATFGVNSRVWVLADTALSGIDVMAPQPYTLVRAAGATDEFLVSGRQRYPIPPTLVSLYSALGDVQVITATQLNTYALSRPAQRAVRASDGNYYLIDADKRFQLAGCAQVSDYGLDCGQLPLVDLAQLSKLSNGGALPHLARLADGSIWLVQAGLRRETPNPAVLGQFGITTATALVSNELLAERPVGGPVLGAGVVTDGQGNYRSVGAGGSYILTGQAAAGKIAGSATRLQVASLAQLPTSGTLPLRANADGRLFIAVDGGWLEVSSGTYVATTFTTIPPAAWTGVPLVRSQNAPHFIRERSSSQTYLASGGSLTRVADAASQQWIASTFGVQNITWIAADGALQGLAVAG